MTTFERQTENILARMRASHDANCQGRWETWEEKNAACESPSGFGTVRRDVTFDGCRDCGTKVARPE